MGTKAKLEYIWLDGYMPTQTLRSKTKVVEDFSGKLEDCPGWSFDGSSTEQAPGGSSDLLLKPVALFPDPGRKNGWLVMTEVLNANCSPHPSNGRATINDPDDDFWFGFEQEYCIWDLEHQRPIGFPPGGFPVPQGPYYCSVGAGKAMTRKTRGLTRSVIALMVPPLPAPSRPSKTTQTLSPWCLTHSCNLTSSTCSFFSSLS